MSSVGSEFPKEQKRVRHALKIYQDLGPGGAFIAGVIEEVLTEAEEAQASGDIVRILRAFQGLKDVQI